MTDTRAAALERSASQVLAEIARALNTSDDSGSAVQEVAQSLQRYFRTWTLGIWLDGRDGVLTLEGLALQEDCSPELGAAIRSRFGAVDLDSDLPGPAAIRAGEPLRWSLEDAADFPDLTALLERLGATGLISIPILVEDEPLGCAVMTQSAGEGLRPEQEDLLMNALGLVGIVFHRFRLLERDRERSLRLRTLAEAVEHLPLGVKVMGPDWTIEWANPAVRDLLGYDPAELAGRRIDELRYDEGPDSVQREIERAVTRGRWSGEVLDRHQDGHAVPVQSIIVPILDAAGEVAAIVDMERDLTEERARVGRMEDAYRLAAVGELAAGVAHEVNNPLQAISSTAELLLLESLPEDTRSDLETIRLEAKRGGVIVRNLLAFARPKPPSKTRVDLAGVVDSVVALRGPQIRLTNIALALETDGPAVHISADPDQLKQVLHNLIGNAAQAVQKAHGSGTIRILVKRVGGDVELVVEDTGPGISDDVLPRIFRPFFTTKQVGEGTGLGLAVSLKLVRENGGELRAENWGHPGVAGGSLGEGGARFIARFPVLEQEPGEEDPEAPAPEPEPERHRILIIDDEPTVASVAARYLTRAGYATRSASSAEEALDHIEGGERYDAIMVDLRMPGMGGQGFHQTIKERHPELLDTLIFASGDIVSPSTRAFLEETHRPTLAKPYELAELKAVIEGMLEAA